MTEKSLTFLQSVNKVLIDKGFKKNDGTPNYSEAEREIGFGATVLSKLAERPDGRFQKDNLEKFLRTFHVNRAWLLNGEGEQYYMEVKADESEVPITIYRDLVEAKSEYRLIPKTILQEEYRIMLKSEIDQRQQMYKEVIEAKNILIETLKDEIKSLRTGSLRAKQA
jgi:hypothetical protein